MIASSIPIFLAISASNVMLTDPSLKTFLVNLNNTLLRIDFFQESVVVYDNSTCFFTFFRIKTVVFKIVFKNQSQFFNILFHQ